MQSPRRVFRLDRDRDIFALTANSSQGGMLGVRANNLEMLIIDQFDFNSFNTARNRRISALFPPSSPILINCNFFWANSAAA